MQMGGNNNDNAAVCNEDDAEMLDEEADKENQAKEANLGEEEEEE